MPDSKATPVVIGLLVTVLIVTGAAAYIFAASMIPGGWIIQLVIAVVSAALVTALVATVWSRIQELNEENPDDYHNY